MSKHRDVAVPGSSFVLARARVPGVFLPAGASQGAPDEEGSALLDIVVERGRIAALLPPGAGADRGPRVDVGGRQVWPRLVDAHAHLDKGQVIPRVAPDGTLHGGSRQTAADRARWTAEDLRARMEFGLRCAYVHGVGTLRTHIDTHEHIAERSWAVLDELRGAWAGRITLQAVGLGPLAAFRAEWGTRLADLVARHGGVLGGATDQLGPYDGTVDEHLDGLLDHFFRLAAERELDVDLHVDQSDDIAMFALPRIARAVLRNGFRRRVVCAHCVNLALQPDEVVRSTIALCAQAGLAFATLPTPMMYLQDRRPGRTPRWRGVTLVQELQAAGLAVALGGDNCRDAWFPFGDHDMLDTWQQAVRVFQIDAPLAPALAMAGPVGADVLGVPERARIAVGGEASFILLAARTLNEAMCRPQSDRIVVDRGVQVREPLPGYEELDAVMR